MRDAGYGEVGQANNWCAASYRIRDLDNTQRSTVHHHFEITTLVGSYSLLAVQLRVFGS